MVNLSADKYVVIVVFGVMAATIVIAGYHLADKMLAASRPCQEEIDYQIPNSNSSYVVDATKKSCGPKGQESLYLRPTAEAFGDGFRVDEFIFSGPMTTSLKWQGHKHLTVQYWDEPNADRSVKYSKQKTAWRDVHITYFKEK